MNHQVGRSFRLLQGGEWINIKSEWVRYLKKHIYLSVTRIYAALKIIFGGELLKKVKITNARFYVSGQNLYIFTKYPGPDPEVSSNGNGSSSGQGVDRNTLANGRTMTVGLNIGFW